MEKGEKILLSSDDKHKNNKMGNKHESMQEYEKMYNIFNKCIKTVL